MSTKEVVHWEHKSKLLCGASLDVSDDRFLVDARWVGRVNCEACIRVLRSDPSVVPPAATGPEPMPEGWKLDASPYYNEATRERRGQSVAVDTDGITTEERVSGYEGYTSTVHVPLSVLRALLATQGLTIVKASDVPSAEDKRVLEACTAMTLRKSKSTRPPFTESVKGYGGGQGVVDAEWARRAAKEKRNA